MTTNEFKRSNYKYAPNRKKKKREKEEIGLSPMTTALIPTEMSKGESDNKNNATKSLITQRLQTDLGRSVGVTAATKLVLLTSLRAQPSHFSQEPCNQKDAHLEICK